MQEVSKAVNPDDIVFVMDSSIGQAAKDQAEAFKAAVAVGSVIITKLDGHAKGGGALSAVAATKSPICFIGTGEHIDDLEPFNTRSFVSRLLGMGDIGGLLNMFEDKKLFDQKALEDKLERKEKFTYRDMQEQFENLLKLGPLNQVMDMIPGLQGILGKGKEQESVARIKRFLTIMNSFNRQELDSDGKCFNTQPNRINRIARGAGVSTRHVQEVIDTYKPFRKVWDQMINLGPKGLDPKNLMQPGRGGQMNMRKIASMFNPQMIAKMGGMGNLQNMMKQFSQAMPAMGRGGKFPGMPPGMFPGS
jgi:signal recognition particle subunit SRP54